ncbi:MAG: helix-turn-helix transcriptional regulator [Gemmatimonadetes bacterium]|nr:helix-turn-helix transcriptional regulator [Gemmatimonadota bacterium]
MSDNIVDSNIPPPPISAQIRSLRKARRWSLDELARRAGTSAPTVHRYESGWDRFEIGTLRKLAAALGASLEVRLRPRESDRRDAMPTPGELARLIRPLFWDAQLKESDLTEHTSWILRRVLSFGNAKTVAAVRAFFGDEAIRDAVRRRGIDARTRNYWKLILDDADAS